MSDNGFTKAPTRENTTTYVKLANLEPNSVMSGIFKSTVQSSNEWKGKTIDSITHYFTLPDGKEIGINGATQLNRRMELVSPGTACRVTYLGKNQEFNSHEVKVETADEAGEYKPVLFAKKAVEASEAEGNSFRR